jgi:hypothetical protein
VYTYNGNPTVANSLVQGGCPTGAFCTNLLTDDPFFVREPDPGLDATWGTTDDDYGDLCLQLGSPAVNAGDSAALPPDTLDLDDDGDTGEPIPVDLAGNPRVVGAAVDMGAYEGSQASMVHLPLVLREY